MGDLKSVHLVLFFTRGVSLKTWNGIGMLERETAIYRRINPQLEGITFVTYGDAEDLHYVNGHRGIRVLCNRWRLPQWWYIQMLCCIHPLSWRGLTVVKSNQVQGADIALKVARRFGKKFIARCGYLPSNIAKWRHGSDSEPFRKAKQLESVVFRGADLVQVTTETMRDAIIERYGLDERIQVVPNYVDIRLFEPATEDRTLNTISYVGRFEKEKNVEALLDAIQGLNVELVMIGRGPLKETLTAKAREEGLSVRFHGNVPNAELPSHLNRSELFIMPSHIEHHPKALLEAMACGLPVIGTEVNGIRELIQHRQTGYLCGTSPDSIRRAVQDVLADKALRERMGRNAREFVVEKFSLERVLEMEMGVLQKVLSAR
jgi:glycosyltransferase involved in cell wall biosynthesis